MTWHRQISPSWSKEAKDTDTLYKVQEQRITTEMKAEFPLWALEVRKKHESGFWHASDILYFMC